MPTIPKDILLWNPLVCISLDYVLDVVQSQCPFLILFFLLLSVLLTQSILDLCRVVIKWHMPPSNGYFFIPLSSIFLSALQINQFKRLQNNYKIFIETY